MNGLIESQNQAKRIYAPLEVSVSLALRPVRHCCRCMVMTAVRPTAAWYTR